LDAGTIPAAKAAAAQAQIFNARLDAFICAVFMILVATIIIDSVRVWIGVLRGTRESKIGESPFVLSRLQAEEL
jgi:carbon starvation protein